VPCALDGAVVVVTGASRGLGVPIALALADAGADLVLAARDAAGLDAVCAQVRAKGRRALAVPADLTRPGDRARLVEAAATLGPVDVLVNNAGMEIALPHLEKTEAQTEAEVALNLLAPIHLSGLLLPGMVARGRGAVVMISSMSAKAPVPHNAVYAATKFGINGFAASVGLELEGSGVHLGVVCPSFVADVGMWADTGVKAPRLMREVAPSKVAEAVLRVVAGAREVLVTPGPIRPALALGQLFPGLDGPLLRWMGVMDSLEARAAQARVAAAGGGAGPAGGGDPPEGVP
jgi:short-subunit dehydrogenase